MFDFKSFTDNLGATLNSLTPRVTVPFAASAWILLYLHRSGSTVLPPTIVVSALVVGVLCTSLAVVGLLPFVGRTVQPLRRHFVLRREQKRIEDELPFLQPRERQIVGCLLATKRRMVEVLPDGEEAKTLIAKGFLVVSPRQPGVVHRDICVEIPIHVWEVLARHEQEFPFDPATQPSNPWRTHWMAR